jgi:hypothetical protein
MTCSLSACSNPLEAVTDQIANNVAGDIAENAIENETGADIEIDGGTIPASWPSDVPKPTGKIIAVYCDVASGCSGSFEIDDAKDGFDSYVAELLSAGYNQTLDMNTEGTYTAVFDNGSQSVTVSGATDGTSETGNALIIITAPLIQ